MPPKFTNNQTFLEQALESHPLMISQKTLLRDAIASMSEARASDILIVEHQQLLGTIRGCYWG